MYALVDCNNFYASCERVFQPQFVGKPVAILSNNDGCVISRSDEALEALMALGYNLNDATKSLEGVSTELSTAERVTYALRDKK